MPPIPLIRLATSSDATLLTDLAIITMREAFGPPHNPAELVEEYLQSAFSQAITETELTDPCATFFVVELPDGTPVGYAKLRMHAPPRRMAERNAIEIQRFYLLQNQIGKGTGQQLMDHCLNWAATEGFSAVWLGVWERNKRAIAFYRKMGFEPFGYHYFQFGSERQRDFWMQRKLTTLPV